MNLRWNEFVLMDLLASLWVYWTWGFFILVINYCLYSLSAKSCSKLSVLSFGDANLRNGVILFAGVEFSDMLKLKMLNTFKDNCFLIYIVLIYIRYMNINYSQRLNLPNKHGKGNWITKLVFSKNSMSLSQKQLKW